MSYQARRFASSTFPNNDNNDNDNNNNNNNHTNNTHVATTTTTTTTADNNNNNNATNTNNRNNNTKTTTNNSNTPGLHNKIPAHKIFARVWVAQEPIFYTINAKIFQSLGPKRWKSCNGDRV